MSNLSFGLQPDSASQPCDQPEIAGGLEAGWAMAALLASRLPAARQAARVTVKTGSASGVFGCPQAVDTKNGQRPVAEPDGRSQRVPGRSGGSFQVLAGEGTGVASGGWSIPQPRRGRFCSAGRCRFQGQATRRARSAGRVSRIPTRRARRRFSTGWVWANRRHRTEANEGNEWSPTFASFVWSG